jgi:hypothetical protein
MTIDIRANVFCNLGPIIEGSLSDSYVQGNGLIYCRGSVTLDGIYQPTLGQVVDFAYQKNGWLSRFPRRLRVLSSFADPFSRQTQIELGCKLTYLKNYWSRVVVIKSGQVLPAISIAASSDPTNPVREQDRGYIPQSIGINTIIDYCLNGLGITSSGPLPFSSRFNGSKFEADMPYVQMLDELLKSAAYIGYLNESEQLVLRNLTDDSGTGPVIGRDEVIAMEPIAVGEQPADRISVTTGGKRLKPGAIPPDKDNLDPGKPQDPPGPPDPPEPPPDPDDPPLPPPPSRVLWTYDESIGSPTKVEIVWNPAPPAKDKRTYTFEYVPFVYTKTEYDDDNRISKRTTTERTYVPVVNGSFVKEALEFYNGEVSFAYPINLETIETYEYYPSGNIAKQTQERYEPKIVSVGKSAIKYTYDIKANGATVKSLYNPPLSPSYMVERTTTEHERWEDRDRQTIIKYSKTKRTTEKLQLFTQEGQQAIARLAEDTTDYGEVVALADYMAEGVVIDSVELQNNVEVSTAEAEQIAPPQQARPDPDQLLAAKNQDDKPVKADIKINAGQQDDRRENDYSMDWTFNDHYVYDQFTNTYKPVGVSITGQVLRFARIQNRLRLANRAGLSLQLEPELVPVRPFDPLYINLDGIVGQYRVNGTSWAFSADGIAAQVDAMFWGGVGTV